MGSAPAKFLFDNDFAAGGRSAKPTISLTEHAAKVAQAEAGRPRAWLRRSADHGRAKAAATLERIAGLLQGPDRSLAAVELGWRRKLWKWPWRSAGSLSGLIAREPLAEISALASDCFRHLVASPHVVVRVNDSLHASA
jgi:flagellar assembly protein FliH